MIDSDVPCMAVHLKHTWISSIKTTNWIGKSSLYVVHSVALLFPLTLSPCHWGYLVVLLVLHSVLHVLIQVQPCPHPVSIAVSMSPFVLVMKSLSLQHKWAAAAARTLIILLTHHIFGHCQLFARSPRTENWSVISLQLPQISVLMDTLCCLFFQLIFTSCSIW